MIENYKDIPNNTLTPFKYKGYIYTVAHTDSDEFFCNKYIGDNTKKNIFDIINNIHTKWNKQYDSPYIGTSLLWKNVYMILNGINYEKYGHNAPDWIKNYEQCTYPKYIEFYNLDCQIWNLYRISIYNKQC